TELRDALDDLLNLLAELFADVLGRRRRVLYAVMQNSGAHGCNVEVEVGDDLRDAHRVDEVRFARAAELAGMALLRVRVAAANQVEVGRRVALGYGFADGVDGHHYVPSDLRAAAWAKRACATASLRERAQPEARSEERRVGKECRSRW